MYDLPRGCLECGQIVGHATYCSRNPIRPIQSEYDRGYEDGRNSVRPVIGCSECGQIVGHTTYCSMNPIQPFQSEYDDGYDAGRRSAGPSGENGFDYCGE